MPKISNNILLVLVAIFLLIVFTQLSFIERPLTSSKSTATGDVSICINHRPVIDISNCSNIASIGSAYECVVNVTDPTINVSLIYADDTSMFNINSTGGIAFTPTVTYAGENLINISVDDRHGCDNSLDSEILNITIAGVCGDGTCSAGETIANCPADCTAATPPPPSTHFSGSGAIKVSPIFELDITEFTLSLKTDGSSHKYFNIENTGPVKLTVDFEVETLSEYITLVTESAVIDKGEFTTIAFDVIAPSEEGVYYGNIIARAGSYSVEIPIILEVEREIFTVALQLPEYQKYVRAGVSLTPTLTVIDLEEGKKNLTIEYQLKNSKNKLISSYNETAEIDGVLSLISATRLDKDLPVGKYVLAAIIEYEDSVSIGSDTFEVYGPYAFFLFDYKIWLVSTGTAVFVGLMLLYRRENG